MPPIRFRGARRSADRQVPGGGAQQGGGFLDGHGSGVVKGADERAGQDGQRKARRIEDRPRDVDDAIGLQAVADPMAAAADLVEGVRMTSNVVDIANDALRIGMPLQVVFEDVGEGTRLPKFRPAG